MTEKPQAMPTSGGAYVRLPDGSLVREDDYKPPTKAKAPPPEPPADTDDED
jgi:hypothetical protein